MYSYDIDDVSNDFDVGVDKCDVLQVNNKTDDGDKILWKILNSAVVCKHLHLNLSSFKPNRHKAK